MSNVLDYALNKKERILGYAFLLFVYFNNFIFVDNSSFVKMYFTKRFHTSSKFKY